MDKTAHEHDSTAAVHAGAAGGGAAHLQHRCHAINVHVLREPHVQHQHGRPQQRHHGLHEPLSVSQRAAGRSSDMWRGTHPALRG